MAIPQPSNEETHDEYMSRCEGAGYTTGECMIAHKGHTFKEEAMIPPKKHYAGEGEDPANAEGCDCGLMTADMCASKGGTPTEAGDCSVHAYHIEKKEDAGWKEKKASESIPLPSSNIVYASANGVITSVEMTVGANSKSVVLIEGVAFHNGLNKNNWELGPDAARSVAEQMVGADLTLNHPATNDMGFGRNMNGGVDEAVVGVVTYAEFVELPNAEWIVRYRAEVHRAELFEALESGMWLRPDYGVSIGGYGVPDTLDASTGVASFNSDFTLDHLAIVYKPAYPDANIESAVRVDLEEITPQKASVSADLKYGTALVSANEGSNMTDAPQTNDAEMEALKAELVLANATIEKHNNEMAAKAEAERSVLVSRASELGMSGHDDLSADTLNNLIASWESANPVVEEPAVEMASVDESPVVASEAVPEPASEKVVANYLNTQVVQSSEDLYARCFNVWASAYNRGLGVADERAPRFEELNTAQRDILSFRGE